MRRLSWIFAFLIATAGLAQACEGQAGKEIFSDDFADDSGGWDAAASAHVADHVMAIETNPKLDSLVIFNTSFNATDGDYCMEAVFPSGPADAGNPDDMGLYVLGVDGNNKFSLNVDTLGEVWVNHTINGQGKAVLLRKKSDVVKTEPGAVNTLRAVVKDQKITFLVNGQPVKAVRAQISPTSNRFGFWAGLDGSAPKQPRVFQIKSYTVTSGQ